jgi:serine phosphatase RsbU (regulator of sigma subunit)
VIDWGIASQPAPGQSVSGDLHVVKATDGGVLLAVVDGVGHGDEATAAAQTATAVLEKHAHESVISLLQRCHSALTQTRGAVMTLAQVQATEGTVTWIGVGNVEGCLLRADSSMSPPSENVLLRGGLVGYQLPALYASVLPLAPGDLLIFATDGIHAGFAKGINLKEPPKQIAQRILGQHFKGGDDALVLVVRYLGPRHE